MDSQLSSHRKSNTPESRIDSSSKSQQPFWSLKTQKINKEPDEGVILVQNICEHVNFQLRFANPYGIFLPSPFKFSYKLP